MSEANNNLPQNNTNLELSLTPKSATSQTGKKENKEKEINWHQLAHKLREHNRKLLKKVFQLEQEVIDNREALAEQIRISKSNDLYVAKQAETINQYQEEITNLLETITQYQQQQKEQQVNVDNLQQQLSNSETQIIELKQECRELQKIKQQQNEDLLATKQQLQELTTRFNRQQQYFLQYKASNNNKVGNQPIKAWSANTDTVPLTATTTPETPPAKKNNDWPAPAIAKTNHPINSIAAVQLPRFPRQIEAE